MLGQDLAQGYPASEAFLAEKFISDAQTGLLSGPDFPGVDSNQIRLRLRHKLIGTMRTGCAVHLPFWVARATYRGAITAPRACFWTTSRHEFLTAAFLCFFKTSRRVMKDSTTTPRQAIAAGASAAAAAASLNFTAAQQATAAAQAAVTSGQGVLSQDPRLNLDP